MVHVKMVKLLILLVCSFFLCVTTVSGQESPSKKCINGEKLCFGLPAGCATSSTFDCTMLVLISAKANPEHGLDVDVYGQGSPNTYYAVGFVPEKGMSGATVVHCDYNRDSTVSVGEGITEGYSFIPISDRTLTQTTSAGLSNGEIHCHWTHRPRGIVDSSSSIPFNVKNPYYVQLAYGPLSNGAVRRHTTRSITDNTINLRSVGVVSSSSTLPVLIRLHGSLMTLAWLCLVSIAMVIARYHKETWRDETICNVKVWFALHRALMVSALSLATIGMISIFVHVKGWRADSPHQYLGVIANILMFLQPLGALFRPAPDHPKRIFFNVMHFLGGNVAHTLAIFALFFVLSLSSVTLSKVYIWTLAVFLAVYISTHLILQFHPQLLSSLNIIADIQLTDLKNEANNQPSSPVIMAIEKSKKRVLSIFIGLVIVISITMIILINKGSPF